MVLELSVFVRAHHKFAVARQSHMQLCVSNGFAIAVLCVHDDFDFFAAIVNAAVKLKIQLHALHGERLNEERRTVHATIWRLATDRVAPTRCPHSQTSCAKQSAKVTELGSFMEDHATTCIRQLNAPHFTLLESE